MKRFLTIIWASIRKSFAYQPPKDFTEWSERQW